MAKDKPKTVGVSKPAPPKVVNVLGIDFEEGDNIRFGKCVNKGTIGPGNARVYNFLNTGNGDILLWGYSTGYLDYFSEREQTFETYYTIVDFDTPSTDVQGVGLQTEIPF